MVPYDMVRPGFEAVYAWEKHAPDTEESEAPAARTTDDEGNVMHEWATRIWASTPRTRSCACMPIWGKKTPQ